MAYVYRTRDFLSADFINKMLPHIPDYQFQNTGLPLRKCDTQIAPDKTRLSIYQHNDYHPDVLHKKVKHYSFHTSMVKSFFSYFRSTLPEDLLSNDEDQVLQLFTYLSLLLKTMYMNTSYIEDFEVLPIHDILIAFHSISNNTLLPEEISSFIESFGCIHNWTTEEMFIPDISYDVLRRCIEVLHHRFGSNLTDLKTAVTIIVNKFRDRKMMTRSVHKTFKGSPVWLSSYEETNQGVQVYSDYNLSLKEMACVAAWKLRKYNEIAHLTMHPQIILKRPSLLMRKLSSDTCNA